VPAHEKEAGHGSSSLAGAVKFAKG
jgi:hypothetical protein